MKQEVRVEKKYVKPIWTTRTADRNQKWNNHLTKNFEFQEALFWMEENLYAVS